MAAVREGLEGGKEWEIENPGIYVDSAVGPGDDKRQLGGQGGGRASFLWVTGMQDVMGLVAMVSGGWEGSFSK